MQKVDVQEFRARQPCLKKPTEKAFSRQKKSITSPFYCVVKDFNAPIAEEANLKKIAVSKSSDYQAPLCEINQPWENYQGHYGEAYRLQFPDYRGNVFVAQTRNFQPSECLNGAVNGNPYVIAGSTDSPYFSLF